MFRRCNHQRALCCQFVGQFLTDASIVQDPVRPIVQGTILFVPKPCPSQVGQILTPGTMDKRGPCARAEAVRENIQDRKPLLTFVKHIVAACGYQTCIEARINRQKCALVRIAVNGRFHKSMDCTWQVRRKSLFCCRKRKQQGLRPFVMWKDTRRVL